MITKEDAIKNYSLKLRGRTNRFINTLGVKKVEFCRNVNISPTTYYDWQAGKIDISEQMMDRIDRYIYHYGF